MGSQALPAGPGLRLQTAFHRWVHQLWPTETLRRPFQTAWNFLLLYLLMSPQLPTRGHKYGCSVYKLYRYYVAALPTPSTYFPF